MATFVSGFRDKAVWQRLDTITVGLFLAMVIVGWLNIYAAVYDPIRQDSFLDIFQWQLNSGKQLLWISLTVFLIIIITFFEFKLFDVLAYPVYGISVLLLILVIFMGREVAGSKSWFDLGFARFQPAEFAKVGTALAISKFISTMNKPVSSLKMLIPLLMIIGLPLVIVLLQNETGTALVFISFVIVFYREGLPQYLTGLGLMTLIVFIVGLLVKETQVIYAIFGILIVGSVINLVIERTWGNIAKLLLAIGLAIGIMFGSNIFVNQVLKPHQQARIKSFFDPNYDKKGQGFQVAQSKIAIGSGGFWGKGYLGGTQTKFDFVPDQHTDFIFCTIGEEWGWFGSLVMIGLFVSLFLRLIILAERQKASFSRIYGYSVFSVLFFHFTINIGMTIGIFPVIGIPLPFFSYGGSSLWSFTILLFIMLKLDAHRTQLMGRN